MRIGQTSIVHFISQLLATVAGFVATIYFARALGAEILGVYFLVVAVYTWLKLFGTMGFRQSVVKRLSETRRQNQRFTAAFLLQLALLSVLCVAIIAGSDYLDAYVGTAVTDALLLLTLGGIAFTFVGSVLRGEKLVHVAAMLKPVERLVRTVLQIGAILAGFTLFGLLYGHVVALLFASLVGIYIISSRPSLPRQDDFESVLSFAKYSWLGGVSTRTFNAMDTLVLGFFVSTTLIGVYEIAWNVASVLAIFGSSVSQAVFPEISELSTDNREEQATSILNDALAFTGLFTIPGLVGAVILGEYVLIIYGPEFRQGYLVLLLLIVARLLAAYQWQFVNALGAFNRPDLAFWINLSFIVVNMILNFALVALYGWIGAAVATACSAALALVLGYITVRSIVAIRIPYAMIGRQVIAALVMGLVVYSGTVLLTMSVPVALVLIVAGSGIYFGALFGISPQFRSTVLINLPETVFR